MELLLTSLDLTISEDYDDKFDALTALEDFSDDLKNTPPKKSSNSLKIG